MATEPPFKRTLFSANLYASDLLGMVKRNVVKAQPGEQVLRWDCPPEEMALIDAICVRGLEVWQAQGITLDGQLARMDLMACHCNGCPLELMRMLMADASDFVSDFSGIGQHIDRATGILRNGYRPIFAKAPQ